jgi:uncharacterized membrane protein
MMDFDIKNLFRKQEEDQTLERTFMLLTGVGVGVGLMYLLDPSLGRRRRAMIADQATGLTHRAGDTITGAAQDLSNRAKGLMHETTGMVQGAASKVTSMFSGGDGADQGNRGAARATGRDDAEIADEPWSPTTRMIVGTAGGALVAYGMTQRFPVACALGTVGLGLVARAVTNFEAERYLGLGVHEPIEVRKSITIRGPVERVFPFFARYDTFPRFMSHIREVKPLEHGRSHWVADGPVGMPVAWDAVETRREQNRLIEWRSEPGSVIANGGSLHFSQAGDGTRVDVRLSYIPPAGTLGHFAAKMFGADPNKMMDEDLQRMKSLIEDGAASTPNGGTVTRQEVTGGGAVPASKRP